MQYNQQLKNLSGAEIIILHVLEDVDSVNSSAVLITSRDGNETRSNYEIKLEGEVSASRMVDLGKLYGSKIIAPSSTGTGNLGKSSDIGFFCS